MSEMQPVHQFIILLVVSIVAAYAVTSLVLGAKPGRTLRVSVSAIVATVFVHAYLILTGQGPDQFVLVSVIMMLIYGAVGSLLLDVVRGKFFTQAK